MESFGKRNVTVTLTGEEWFAIILKEPDRPLSVDGERIWRAAAKKMGDQVVAASKVAH